MHAQALSWAIGNMQVHNPRQLSGVPANQSILPWSPAMQALREEKRVHREGIMRKVESSTQSNNKCDGTRESERAREKERGREKVKD